LRKDGNRLVATFTHELTTDQVLLETDTEPLAEVFFELQNGAATKAFLTWMLWSTGRRNRGSHNPTASNDNLRYVRKVIWIHWCS